MALKLSSHTPGSTYRVQLHGKFTFSDLAALSGYFKDLGITDLYLSPILASVPGSKHGYDVTDYSEVNAELGGYDCFERLSSVLREHGCGIILDFVPNHMGIAGVVNQWWRDVLEYGPASKYASFFDIQWKSEPGEDHPRILAPILCDHYGRVLERGEIKAVYEEAFFIKHQDTLLPIRPECYRAVLGPVEAVAGAPLAELAAALEASGPELAPAASAQPPKGEQRAHSLKAEFAALISRDKKLQALIDKRLADLNGKPGEPRSFDELHGLIERQHYRIARWQAGAHEINYRRFFAIDTLIGLHMENPAVFKECHALVARLLSLGLISGLRIDHIDGLRQPEAYLQRLQSLDRTDKASPLYVVVEKILAQKESLPESWPVHGTTGYEFIADVAALQTDASQEAAFSRIYRDYTGDTRAYDEVVRKSKRLVIDEMFANAVNNLGADLVRIVEEDRDWRDLTRHELTTAVSELAAHFPVYRTYRSGPKPMGGEDSRFVDAACAAAIADNPRADPQPFEFVRDLIIGRYPLKDAPASMGAAIVAWVLTFQQYSGAIMAKAVEDTAFYNYNRLVALNEVGCSPGHFGGTLEASHRANEVRLAHMASSLVATSTHDSKFSEDVRTRLYALSEIPWEWSAWLAEWGSLSDGLLSEVDRREAPDASDRYRFFQELLAVWPVEPSPDDGNLRERLRNHFRKVVDEAKRHTSILNKNEDYLHACDRFSDGLLGADGAPGFLQSFEAAAARVARLGMVNSLAQLVLKCTVPGVPDFYQGCETWCLSLVDPDNRRPVDYEHHKRLLEAASDASVGDLLRDWKTGAIKIRLTRELLSLRRSNRALFAFGDYRAVETTGPFSQNVFAFERRQSSGSLLVAVPRLTARIGTPPVGAVWEDTKLVGITKTAQWRDIVTGRLFDSKGELQVRELFSEAPFAVLHAGKEGA